MKKVFSLSSDFITEPLAAGRSSNVSWETPASLGAAGRAQTHLTKSLSASSQTMPPAPASPFAALLRRSKFASLDTSIAQVYTSSGGDLSRGNWGLKRPLPIRRRGAHITVKAVDSKEQQTEWDVADQQAKWIKMWDEVGITPSVGETGPWFSRLGPKVHSTDEPFDSDYSKGVRRIEENQTSLEGEGLTEGEVEAGAQVSEEVPEEIPEELTEEQKAALDEKRTLLQMLEAGPGASMPNISAMSDSEFQKYLEKVRALRPTFQAYRNLVADASRRETRETQWLDIPADYGSQSYRTFLAKHAEHDLTAPSSRTIEQQPQQVAGLTYTRGSLLQSHLLTPPQPGRVLNKNKSNSGSRGAENVTSFAGMLPTLAENHRGDTKATMDWKRLATVAPSAPGGEAGQFRLISARLVSAPNTVGSMKAGLQGTFIDSDVKAVTEEDLQAHRQPGTREYSGYRDNKQPRSHSKTSQSATSIKAHLFHSENVSLHVPSAREVKADDILGALEGIVSNSQ